MATTADRIATQATDTRSFIDHKWDFADDKAEAAFNRALTALDAMVAAGLPPITYPSLVWEDIVADFSIEVSKPTLPAVTWSFPTSKPVVGNLIQFPVFTFPESLFNSLNQEVLEAIRNKLAAGGTGLGTDAEAALWARMRGRQNVKNEEMYNETLNFFASRGFDLPPGSLSAKLLQIQTEISRSEDDLNNDITVEQARLMLENEKFIYELALRTITDYRRGLVESIAIQNKNVVDVFVAEMDAYKTEIMAEMSRVEALIKVTTGLLDAYRAEISAEATMVEAKTKVIDAKLRIQLGKADVALKVADLEMTVVKFVWSTLIEVQKTIATIAAQLAASAMASVNASVSSSYAASSSEGISESTTNSYDKTKQVKSTSESHNFNYDMTS